MIARSLLAAVSVVALATAASAVEPVGSDSFNLDTPFDLSALTLENFEATLRPVATEEGTLVFYDFTESFTPLFTETVIPAFEAAYPEIDVQYFSVDGSNAVQQLIAARQANQPSPADVFFMPNGQVKTANQAGIIANLPLATMLPSAQDLEPNAATVARGYDHGGVVVPYHRNQTAIGYDTRFVSAEDAPKTLDELLAYAQANPMKVAVTSPARGGSGSGFLESAILAKAPAECQGDLYNFDISEDDAKAWAAGPCLEPVMAYFRELKPVVEITNGNSDTLTLIANGQASVGTVWEDMGYDFIGRGLLPPTVKFRLLETGQVGDGDGVMIPSGTERPAAALLFVNFLLSDAMQLKKLELNGSRTARTRLDISGAMNADLVERLVPNEQYLELSRPRISNVVSSAAQARFVEEILQLP